LDFEHRLEKPGVTAACAGCSWEVPIRIGNISISARG